MSTIEERVAALESALASMTAAEKRIVELPAASSVANDDFVALDGVANGSRRFAASNLGGKAEVMTEAEWDDLPDSKLTDGKVYALSGVSPSTQDNPLWQKLGFASLDTTADDCSDAINELNTGLTTLNSKLGYTLVGSVTGTTEVNLPANWKEIIVVVGYSGSYMNSVSIPYAFASNSTVSMGFGIFGTSYAIGYVSKTKVSLNTVNWGGSTVTSSSTLSVYAR